MSEVQISVERREVIRGVGTNLNFDACWQSPDLPSPTITTAPQRLHGGGWIWIDMTTWIRRTGTGQMAQGDANCETDPSPVVMAGGLGGATALSIGSKVMGAK